MESSKLNLLGRCFSPLKLILDSGVPVENMAVADTEDLGTSLRGTVFVPVLMEEHPSHNTTLNIVLPLCNSDRMPSRAVRKQQTLYVGLVLLVTHRRGGPDSFSTTPSYHSTTTPSTPLALRRARMSREALSVVSAVVVVG
jgi:hypothetical protein